MGKTRFSGFSPNKVLLHPLLEAKTIEESMWEATEAGRVETHSRTYYALMTDGTSQEV